MLGLAVRPPTGGHGVAVLAPGQVGLWRASLDIGAPALEALGRVLSAEERQRATRLRRPQDRRRFVTAHGWLRCVLASYLGCHPSRVPLLRAPGGKPCLGSGCAWLRFNLSHAGEIALLAVARGHEVGVDVEALAPDLPVEALAHRVLTAAERRLLDEGPRVRREHAFLALWTRKEAYLKGLGVGLRLDPAAADLGAPLTCQGAIVNEVQVGSWRLRDVDAGVGYIAAIAVRGTRMPLPARALWWPLPADGATTACAPPLSRSPAASS